MRRWTCRFCDEEASVILGDMVLCTDCHDVLQKLGRKGLSELDVEDLQRLENILTQSAYGTITILEAIKAEIEARLGGSKP